MARPHRTTRIVAFALAGVLSAVTSGAAQAVPIRTLPGLVSVQVFEVTGSEVLYNMVPSQAVIGTRLPDPLSATNNDYRSPANEFYDFFYSDATGAFDIDGAYLTVSAVFDNPVDSGLNISRARLVFTGGAIEYANAVTNVATFGGAQAFPATAANALGNTPGTTTFLGHTSGQDPATRLSLTLGFASTAPATAMSEPGPMALLAGVLLSLGLLRRRRSTA